MNENGSVPKSDFASAEEAMAWITGLTPLGIRPGLGRIQALMERFGNPERRLKFIHVAGTNGKGSVCAYLTSVLRQSGYDVGTFTSPYITSYSNRLQYNEGDIDDETLLRLANLLRPEAVALAESEWGSPTMFEVTTALALLYYGTVVYPDYVVWETGIGGRIDVTNIVTPVVSVITNVGHDHMDILGPTIEDIAREKAGIIKAGVPVITAASQPDALAVIRETAAGKRASLYGMGKAYTFEMEKSDENEQIFTFHGPYRTIQSIRLKMAGAHQIVNAAAAVMTLEALRQFYALIVDDEELRAGLERTFWPGRLEMIPRSPRILLDGAHNPEGMETLAAALRDVYSYDRLHVLLAMMPNKNHEHSLKHILPLADTLVITEPDYARKMSAADLAAVAVREGERLGKRTEIIVEPDWRKALERLDELSAAGPGTDNVLNVVAGTLYLIADVRSWLLHGKKSDKGW